MDVGGTKVSIYRNIFDKTSKYTISVSDALQRIKTGHSQTWIIMLRTAIDEDAQKRIKDGNLPSITFSGTFSERFDNKLITHSGFVCMDFDNVNVDEYLEKFKKWDYTYACWVSPRGTGFKVLLRIANGKKHREHYTALKKEFPNLDPKCINESRVCYESYDPNIYINEKAKVYTACVKTEVIEEKNVTTDTFEVYRKLVKWTENSCKTNKKYEVGNRNYFAFVLAGAMCRYGVAQEDAENLIVKDYAQKDFGHKEISKSIGSAYRTNRASFGIAEFSNDSFIEKETRHEVNPDVLMEGFKPDDVIYGSDVYEGAIDIYEHGYKTAETTFIPVLDEYFKFKRGELTLVSGIGNYGKSSYLYQLELIRSYMADNKWAIFSPEHFPAEEFYHDLTEVLLGCRCDGGATVKPSKETYSNAYEFISQHFFYVYSKVISPSPQYIKTKFLELILREKVDGVVIDPFNQLVNDYKESGGRTDKYLETFLSDCAKFAKENNVFFIIVAHPHKLQKGSDGNYPCPDVFDLADGAMWNNKCDNILIYHRPLAQTEPDSHICEHHSKKIRRQKQIGKRGNFQFELNRARRRFYFNGFNPLDGNRFEPTTMIQQNGSPKPALRDYTEPLPADDF